MASCQNPPKGRADRARRNWCRAQNPHGRDIRKATIADQKPLFVLVRRSYVSVRQELCACAPLRVQERANELPSLRFREHIPPSDTPHSCPELSVKDMEGALDISEDRLFTNAQMAFARCAQEMRKEGQCPLCRVPALLCRPQGPFRRAQSRRDFFLFPLPSLRTALSLVPSSGASLRDEIFFFFAKDSP